jgi:uncharacterized protein (DUF1778 family)
MATRRGRPALPAEQRRGRPEGVRWTPTEREILEDAAEAQGLDASEYVRRSVAYCAAQAVPLAEVITSTVTLSPEEMARLVELTKHAAKHAARLTPEQRAAWERAARTARRWLSRK